MKWTRLAAFGCLAVLCVGCNRKAVNEERESAYPSISQSETAGTTGDQRRDTGQAGTAQQTGPTDVRDFVNRVAIANTAEIQVGQLAGERTQNRDVKQFAAMMVRDHTQAGNELKQAVSAHGVQMPSGLDAKHEAVMKRLRDLHGAEFDREYMKTMVEGHREARDLIRSRALGTRSATSTTGTAGGDPITQLESAVGQWAMKTLPTVEQHLQKAEQISNTMGSTERR